MSTVRASRVSSLMTKSAAEKLEKKSPKKEEFKRFLQAAGAYTLGTGIGSALGYVANRTLLPKILKQLSPHERDLLAGGIGAAAAIASSEGTRRVFEHMESGKSR